MTYPAMKTTVCVLALLMGACALVGGGDGTRADLEAHRRLWNQQAIDSYAYDLNIGCFCPVFGPVRVFVLADTVANVVPSDTLGRPAPTTEQIQFYARTIDDLFGVIENALARNADDLQVTYDAALGYPTRISIDFEKNAVDDEVVYQADNLLPLHE
jgi:hypothetical protein